MLTPRSVKHIAASRHSKAAALSKKNYKRTPAPHPCQRHDTVAGGVWYGEVHVFIRVRHHGTDVPLDLIEQPAPIGGGEIRLPDQRDIAPFKEVPDETFPAKVVLQLAGTFDDGLHHLQSPRGPMGSPVVSQHPVGGSKAVADARRCSNHSATIAGTSSTPRGTLRATIRRRIEPVYGRDLPPPSSSPWYAAERKTRKPLRRSARRTRGR